MRKLSTYLSGGMSRSLKLAFTMMFIMINLAVITVNTVYIQASIRDQNESLVEMVVHLSIFSDDETVITYLEHYGHTHEVYLSYETLDGTYRHVTNPPPESGIVYPVRIAGETHGTLEIDNAQSNLFMANLTYLVILNVIIIVFYLLAIFFFNRKIHEANQLVLYDFKRLHEAAFKLDFSATYRFEDVHALAESFELSYDKLRTLQEKHKDHVEKLAHDIKTPLTIIKGLVDGVVSGRLRPDDDIKGSLNEEVARISGLIDTIIGDVAVSSMTTFDLSRLVADTVKKQTILFTEKDIELKKDIAADVQIHGSYEDMRRVLEHLLMNSLKFTPPQSYVKIIVEATPKRLIVEDGGEGMDAKTKARLFKPVTSETGTGVGLTIVKTILERHHASITVESEVGKGSRFIIDFGS